MADTSGMAEIRGIDIDKLAKGFADEQFIFKNFLTVTDTQAREIRWYKKTSGVLDSTDTTGITASQIANVASGTLPVVVEESWTRQTSYIRKYFVESPWITFEDIKDSDVDLIGGNVRSLTRSVAKQVDVRIFDVLTEDFALTNVNRQHATGTGWDDTSNGNPILDLLSGATAIRGNNYEINGLVALMNQVDYKNLLNYLITVKGSSIPSFAAEKAESGVLMNIVGQRVVVSPNISGGVVIQIVPQRAATWKTFMPITAQQKEEVGIGIKIRVWEEGEAILTDPKAVCVTTNVE